MDNPNEYDDDAFTRASISANDAVGGLWTAGASLGDIEEIVANALDNEDVKVTVTITDA